MTAYKVWISNYNKPSDGLRSYPEKLVKSDYPSVAGKTIRVYVRSRESALDDVTRQLEELRQNDRLRPGDSAHLRDAFCEGEWTVGDVRVTLQQSS